MHGTKTISLTKGFETIVDAQDYEWVMEKKWHANVTRHGDVYVRHDFVLPNGKTRGVYLHRLLLNAPPGMQVDHVDGNTLNNRRSNLRLATSSQNHANRHRPRKGATSRYKGVLWYRRLRKWQARITKDGRIHYLGVFSDEVQAAKAYDVAARELYGEFAYTNFREEQA